MKLYQKWITMFHFHIYDAVCSSIDFGKAIKIKTAFRRIEPIIRCKSTTMTNYRLCLKHGILLRSIPKQPGTHTAQAGTWGNQSDSNSTKNEYNSCYDAL